MELPPYTYVPGYAPHPISDPDGHLRAFRPPESWGLDDHFRWGVRLFQNGYYWEAHEAWEHVWLELGRTSDEAVAVKGLIKLAASGVKCREGQANGAVRHAMRAAELLSAAPESLHFAGEHLAVARRSADKIAASPPVNHVAPSDRPIPLPGFEI